MGRIRVDVDAADAVEMIEDAVKAVSPPQITASVEAGADVLQEGARRRAPRRSGRLESSIQKSPVSAYEFEVGTDLVYAQITEFGGTIRPNSRRGVLAFNPGGGVVFSRYARIPAQPYISPTFEQDGEQATEAIADAIERDLAG